MGGFGLLNPQLMGFGFATLLAGLLNGCFDKIHSRCLFARLQEPGLCIKDEVNTLNLTCDMARSCNTHNLRSGAGYSWGWLGKKAGKWEVMVSRMLMQEVHEEEDDYFLEPRSVLAASEAPASSSSCIFSPKG